MGIATLLRRIAADETGVDPAQHFSVFRNIGNTYLYKLMPDGTPSREGDNEYPILDSRDTTLIGYAVNRFKDPYCAWLLRNSGFFAKQWVLPVLEFLWDDPEVAPRDPAIGRLNRTISSTFFPGVGHLVMRDGWKSDSTWIEFDCGPYFAKHQHLDQNHFTIYHGGYLAIDSGADYTDTESPHYLNYYRRTVAHNSVLVYDPAEKFFWSDNVGPAANDGGQRMDSSRYWNTIRSEEDWNRTRDLWDLGNMTSRRPLCPVNIITPWATPAMLIPRTKAAAFYPRGCLCARTGSLVRFRPCCQHQKSFRKAWLLHGVNQPERGRRLRDETEGCNQDFRGGQAFLFREGSGELMVHSLLPKDRVDYPAGWTGK